MRLGNVGIIGASGWLGEHLSKALLDKGWKVTAFSRSPRSEGNLTWRQWDGEGAMNLTGLDAVINLAGEAIDQRWTEARKLEFRKSRVDLTERLVQSLWGKVILRSFVAIGKEPLRVLKI